MASMITGKVKWFDRKKGFGFIAGDDGVDVFVHYANIALDGYKTLNEGDAVVFEVEHTPKGPQARQVSLAGGAGA